MKRKSELILWLLPLFAALHAAMAADGSILFGNRNIDKADQSGTYNVPIYVDANLNGLADPGEGIGQFATNASGPPATLGLFLSGQSTSLVSAPFRIDQNSQYLAVSSQTATFLGHPAGERLPLT